MVEQCERVDAAWQVDVQQYDRRRQPERFVDGGGRIIDPMKSAESALHAQPALERIDQQDVVVDAHHAERRGVYRRHSSPILDSSMPSEQHIVEFREIPGIHPTNGAGSRLRSR